jgi:YfiR/HmsC-like
MPSVGRRFAWLLLWLPLVLAGPGRAAAASGHDQQRVQAAFLYNFLKFCTWPGAADGPLVIGAFREAPDAALGEVAGKTAGGRPVAVRRVDSLEEARTCQLLLVPVGSRPRLERLLAGLSGQPVLTVSEIEDFARLGGIIGLVRSGDRLRFEVNLDAARDAGLELSSQLLKLASIVWQKGGARDDP